MEPNIDFNIQGLLDRLNKERFSEISLLIEPGSDVMSRLVLKEIIPKVTDIATSNPESFLNAAMLYYLRLIQSIKSDDLASDYSLIPQYLKTIEIMKNISNAIGISFNFEPLLNNIIHIITEIFILNESFEKKFEFLKILKEIMKKFEFKIKDEWSDVLIMDYMENEKDLIQCFFIIKKIKEEWRCDLSFSESVWIAKARAMLEEEKESFDKNFIKTILIYLHSFTDQYNSELEDYIIHFCEDFDMDSSEILHSEISIPKDFELPHDNSIYSLESFPFLENHLITNRSQFILKKRPISKQREGITVWQGYFLVNLEDICVKEYTGSSQEILDQYTKEVNINQTLSRAESPLYLKYFGSCEDGDRHYFIIEFCKKDLRYMISEGRIFTGTELAYFAYLFIKGHFELKTKEHIYHRDIKPENIMINNENEFKLIDFNISYEFIEDSVQIGLAEHSKKFTLIYCSPEKLKYIEGKTNQHYSQELNDVYSLGLVILEMSTLEEITTYRKNEELFYQKMEEQFKRIQISWLGILLRSMLDPDEKRRPRFMALLEMIEKSDEFMNDLKENDNKRESI